MKLDGSLVTMVHSQVLKGGNSLQFWMVAANIMNKRDLTAIFASLILLPIRNQPSALGHEAIFEL
jgi:hypothetical protein